MVSQNVPCPDAERLRRFSLGCVDHHVLDTVAEHLETCPACLVALEKLETDEDSLLAALQVRVEPESLIQEAAYQRALASVRAIGTRDRQSQSVPAASGDDTASPPWDEEHSLGSRALGQYELLEKIGEGGMGVVYRARHSRLKRIVAVKVLNAHRLKDTQAVARFEREMEAVGRLRHPNIVAATDADEADGLHFLVMEYLEGLDLSELVRRQGPLAVPDACELIRQVAAALDYIHQKGLVHRDIKPSNLMITSAGQVKIMDLGLALLSTPGQSATELTGSRQLLGTLDYMAPEQCDDSHTVDIRADIYSLGVTLYKLLTGTAPFDDAKFDSPVKKLAAITKGEVPPIGQKRSDVPEPVAELVHRMLAKDPGERYRRPADVVDAVAPLAVASNLPALLQRASESEGGELSVAESASDDRAWIETRPRVRDGTEKPLGKRTSLRRSYKTTSLVAATIAAVVLLFATVFLVRMGKVTFTVNIRDPQVVAQLSLDGIVVLDTSTGGRYVIRPGTNRLPTGDYSAADGSFRFEVTDADGLYLATDRFTLRRGDHPVVTIVGKRDSVGTDLSDDNPAVAHVALTVLGENEDRLVGFPKPIGLVFDNSQPEFRVASTATAQKPLRISRLLFRREDTVASGRKSSRGQDLHTPRSVNLWVPIADETHTGTTSADTQVIGTEENGRVLRVRPARPLEDGVYCLHTDQLTDQPHPTFIAPFVIRGWGKAELVESTVRVDGRRVTLLLNVLNAGEGELNDACIRVTLQREAGAASRYEDSKELWPDPIPPNKTREVVCHWDATKWQPGNYHFYGYLTSRYLRTSRNSHCKFDSDSFEVH